MGRVFKTRYFARWMRKTALTDRALCVAVREMAGGLIDADLGGGVIKKRVALPGRGKRGSTRTLLATNRQDRWFFLFGLEKNDRANISERELDALQALADDLLKLDSRQLDAQVDNLALDEICDENQV
jgi:hypothetical protein